MASRVPLSVLHLVLAAYGCAGSADRTPDPAAQPAPGSDPVSFACDAASPATTPTPMRRLSVVQYRNTLADLLKGVGGLETSGAWAGLARLPPDGDGVGEAFSGMDARFSSQHGQAFYDVADAVAEGVTADDGKLLALGTACATQEKPTAACVDQFLDGFARRAYRRPLTMEERTRYQALNDGARDGRELFRSLVFSVLLAPQFLYQVELDGAALAGSPESFTLSSYELASRLSYHFWQTMPDDQLFRAASDGSILTPEGYAAEVQRLFSDARTRQTVETFYAEWFRLGAIPGFLPSTAFTNLVAGSPIQDPAAAARFLQAASEEITALTNHYTWQADGTFRDLLLSDLSVTGSGPLAGMYGVKPWDGVAAPPRLDSNERGGLLTRASLLISGTHTTHPIHRGSLIRRRILCDELPDPDPTKLPPGALDPPPPSSSQTTRQRFEAKVAAAPCASCHALMNPIGYVLESYDAVGRYRTTERLFDDASGEEVGRLPVDAVAVARISPGDDRPVVSGPDLGRRVADSGRTEACFARQYFRFTHHREEAADDGCALEHVRTALAQGNLREALVGIAMSPGFRTRKAP